MSTKELVLSCFRAVFRPRSTEALAAWMARNILISSTENPGKVGRYDPDYNPLIPRLLDMFTGSAEWNECLVRKSAQCGLSMHSLGLITRRVAEDPTNIMYVIDSDKEVKKISERLVSFLANSPETAGIMAEAADDLTKLTLNLPGMKVWLTGAGSAGSLANKTAGLGIGDEVDKHANHTGEATTLDLLRARGKEQPDFKFLAYSTPTTTSGQINKEHATGSQHVAFVPCPHCGEFQELVWERVKFGHCKDLTGEWDRHRVLEETYYECARCHGEIRDHHKRDMVAAGEWRPTNFRTVTDPDGTDRLVPNWHPGKLSAHYSDLYSQNPNVSFGRLALKFIAALQDPMKMRDFLQNYLGKPDEETVGQVTEDRLLALRGAYRRQRPDDPAAVETDGRRYDTGTPIPVQPLFCALIADTQDENSKWTVQAFTRTGDQYVLDWGESLELLDLDAIAERSVRWQVEGEHGETPISVTMIDDGGHRTFEVRQHCYDRFPACFPSRGSSGAGGQPVAVRDYRIRKDDPMAPTMPVIVYDDSTFKRELYIRRIAKFDAKKAEAYEQPRLWLPVNLETEFTAELMRERLERQKDGTFRWNKPKGNDYGDTLKMGIILWAYLSPELLKDAALADRENEEAAA